MSGHHAMRPMRTPPNAPEAHQPSVSRHCPRAGRLLRGTKPIMWEYGSISHIATQSERRLIAFAAFAVSGCRLLSRLVSSSSLPLQWTARCCYCWLCSVWCLFPLLVSGAISFFLLRLCLRWCPLSVELPPRLASRRRDRHLCPVAGLWGGGVVVVFVV